MISLLAALLLSTASNVDAVAGPNLKGRPPAAAPVPAAEEDFDDENVQTAGGIVKFGETVTIREGEQIEGPVVSIGGSARVEGSVNGPVIAIGGSVELGPRAEINGLVVSIGGKTARAGGAHVDGPIIETPGARFFGGLAAAAAYVAAASISFYLIAKVSASIGWIVLGVAFVGLFPKAMDKTRLELERRPGRSTLAGIVLWPAALAVSITLGLSLIGIPLVPVLCAAVAAAYAWGFAALGYCVGIRITQGRWDNPMISMALGIMILKAIQWLPIVGWLICALVLLTGTGASVLSRFGLKKD